MKVILSILLFVFTHTAFAGDLEWSGLYRIEGQSIQNPDLDSERNKDYGVHHLIMRPKIVAADGLYIQGQFHILNNSGSGGPQLGSIWGSGVDTNTNTAGSSDSSDSSTLQENQKEDFFSVSEFYVSLTQEFGSLIAGRAPLQFGLGMTYDAGKDLFDHYYNNRDLVGYKIVMGNFFFMPMFAKIDEAGISGSTDIDEIILHFQYENPEDNVAMGVMYNNRTTGQGSNNVPVDTGSAFEGGSVNGEYNIKNLSIFYEKSWSEKRVGFEIINQSGDFGVSVGGDNVEASAFAFAFEYDSMPREKRLHWGIRAGIASGDDPTTNDEYEGFTFNRNYDIAVLLFNHALGQANLMRTQNNGTRYGTLRDGTAVNSAFEDPDIEGIGNAYYFAPQFTYKWRDRWDIKANFTAAWLDQADFSGVSGDNDLGYEIDLSLVFRPNERLVWENTVATFLPGSAWEVGTNNFSTDTAMGFVSRAAISF